MTKSTNQRRTVASVLKLIQNQIDYEQNEWEKFQHSRLMREERISVLRAVLAEAEKNGSDDEYSAVDAALHSHPERKD